KGGFGLIQVTGTAIDKPLGKAIIQALEQAGIRRAQRDHPDAIPQTHLKMGLSLKLRAVTRAAYLLAGTFRLQFVEKFIKLKGGPRVPRFRLQQGPFSETL